MIDPNIGADLFKEVLKVDPKNRSWAINVIVICMAIAICITVFFVFQAQKSQAIQDKLKAESKLETLQLLYVDEGKECPGLIQNAVEKRDLYWTLKLDNLQNKYLKKFEDEHRESILKFKYLNEETKKVKKRTEQLNKKITE
jgi:hypothetical protein